MACPRGAGEHWPWNWACCGGTRSLSPALVQVDPAHLDELQVRGVKWISRWQWETQKKSCLVPGKTLWAWQAEQTGTARQMICPVPGDIPAPAPQRSSHCSLRVPSVSVALSKAQGKLVSVRAQALSRNQGKLRHKNLHMIHAMVADKAMQLSHTALASP